MSSLPLLFASSSCEAFDINFKKVEQRIDLYIPFPKIPKTSICVDSNETKEILIRDEMMKEKSGYLKDIKTWRKTIKVSNEEIIFPLPISLFSTLPTFLSEDEIKSKKIHHFGRSNSLPPPSGTFLEVFNIFMDNNDFRDVEIPFYDKRVPLKTICREITSSTSSFTSTTSENDIKQLQKIWGNDLIPVEPCPQLYRTYDEYKAAMIGWSNVENIDDEKCKHPLFFESVLGKKGFEESIFSKKQQSSSLISLSENDGKNNTENNSVSDFNGEKIDKIKIENAIINKNMNKNSNICFAHRLKPIEHFSLIGQTNAKWNMNQNDNKNRKFNLSFFKSNLTNSKKQDISNTNTEIDQNERSIDYDKIKSVVSTFFKNLKKGEKRKKRSQTTIDKIKIIEMSEKEKSSKNKGSSPHKNHTKKSPKKDSSKAHKRSNSPITTKALPPVTVADTLKCDQESQMQISLKDLPQLQPIINEFEKGTASDNMSHQTVSQIRNFHIYLEVDQFLLSNILITSNINNNNNSSENNNENSCDNNSNNNNNINDNNDCNNSNNNINISNDGNRSNDNNKSNETNKNNENNSCNDKINKLNNKKNNSKCNLEVVNLVSAVGIEGLSAHLNGDITYSSAMQDKILSSVSALTATNAHRYTVFTYILNLLLNLSKYPIISMLMFPPQVASSVADLFVQYGRLDYRVQLLTTDASSSSNWSFNDCDETFKNLCQFLFAAQVLKVLNKFFRKNTKENFTSLLSANSKTSKNTKNSNSPNNKDEKVEGKNDDKSFKQMLDQIRMQKKAVLKSAKQILSEQTHSIQKELSLVSDRNDSLKDKEYQPLHYAVIHLLLAFFPSGLIEVFEKCAFHLFMWMVQLEDRRRFGRIAAHILNTSALRKPIFLENFIDDFVKMIQFYVDMRHKGESEAVLIFLNSFASSCHFIACLFRIENKNTGSNDSLSCEKLTSLYTNALKMVEFEPDGAIDLFLAIIRTFKVKLMMKKPLTSNVLNLHIIQIPAGSNNNNYAQNAMVNGVPKSMTRSYSQSYLNSAQNSGAAAGANANNSSSEDYAEIAPMFFLSLMTVFELPVLKNNIEYNYRLLKAIFKMFPLFKKDFTEQIFERLFLPRMCIEASKDSIVKDKSLKNNRLKKNKKIPPSGSNNIKNMSGPNRSNELNSFNQLNVFISEEEEEEMGRNQNIANITWNVFRKCPANIPKYKSSKALISAIEIEKLCFVAKLHLLLFINGYQEDVKKHTGSSSSKPSLLLRINGPSSESAQLLEEVKKPENAEQRIRWASLYKAVKTAYRF